MTFIYGNLVSCERFKLSYLLFCLQMTVLALVECWVTQCTVRLSNYINIALAINCHIYIYIYIYMAINCYIYRVSQEECARLREGVPYVKVYRYNLKHLCPKLNGHGDNGQRKVWSSGGSTHCTCQLRALSMLLRWVWYHMTAIQLTLVINRICTSFRVMT